MVTSIIMLIHHHQLFKFWCHQKESARLYNQLETSDGPAQS
jgi:hypothetical protein